MWRLKVAEGGGSPWLRTVNNHCGRQVWEYDPDLGSAEDRMAVEEARANFTRHRFQLKHSSDLLMRMQLGKENPCDFPMPRVSIGETEDVSLEAVTATLQRAVKFYSTIQAHDGHWAGDYGGPMFLMPGLVIALYVTGALHNVLSSVHIQEICRYLYNHQNEDGGWGLHIEGHSTMFCTALSYVTLRLLGQKLEGTESGQMEKAQKWVLDHGSVTMIPSWGKMWLSVLGVYDWSGNNPLPPETWLLPYIIPLHPAVFFYSCFYLSSWVCITFFTFFLNYCCFFLLQEDLYYPHPLVQDIFWETLHKIGEPILMHWPGSILRKKALQTVMQHIHYEDENTRYICIGPVNKVLNMLCCWIEDPNSEAFKFHLARIPDYLWVAEDGMKMNGYNGSQLWDTAFAVQSIISAKLENCEMTLRKAHDYIKNSQVLADCPGDLRFWYRHISKGAWPFSTADHGWPISDCTSEGLKAALLLSKLPSEMVGEPLAAERLYDAVNVILSLQNSGGGFATYELTRSYAWLELINPAETFGDIVIDYPYGSWGVCFTYGLWFGIKGLASGGMTYHNCIGIRKACEFLLAKQLPSGGWGESYLSSQKKVYSNLKRNRPHLVNTAWAMLALIDAGQFRTPCDKLMESGINSSFLSQPITWARNDQSWWTISLPLYLNVFLPPYLMICN
ncbi:unnamed protein product [Victoria cruziana]